MRRHVLLSLGMSCCGTLASPCKPSNPNVPSTTVTSGFSSPQLGESTYSATVSTPEKTMGGSTILISLSTDSTSSSIEIDLESLSSATIAASTELLSTSALPSLSVPSSTASTDSKSSIGLETPTGSTFTSGTGSQYSHLTISTSSVETTIIELISTSSLTSDLMSGSTSSAEWKPTTTSETAMVSVSSVETYSTSPLSTTLTTSTDTISTIITSTSVPTSDTIIDTITTSTTDVLSTLPISSIPSMSSHATDSVVLSTSQETPSSSAISSTISPTTESFSVSAVDSTTLTTIISTSPDTTTSSPASTSSVAPLLFKAIVQDGPAARTPARLGTTGARVFSIGSFWSNSPSPSSPKEATLTIDPITGQLMLSDGTKICAQYERNRESARVHGCAPVPTQQDSYINCDLGSKPGDVLQCKATVLSCTLEDGATSCQSTEMESTKFYALHVLDGYWTLYIGPADHIPDNMSFGVNFLIEKI